MFDGVDLDHLLPDVTHLYTNLAQTDITLNSLFNAASTAMCHDSPKIFLNDEVRVSCSQNGYVYYRSAIERDELKKIGSKF